MDTGTTENPTGGMEEIVSFLHLIAALVLLLFGASHAADMLLPKFEHSFRNIVFPFLTDQVVFSFAAVFEITMGLLCLKYRGRNITNGIILAFVGIMLVYRWGFHFLGGTECGCVGILGTLFRLNQTQERTAPIFALVLLTLTTAPWLYSLVTNSVLNRVRRVA